MADTVTGTLKVSIDWTRTTPLDLANVVDTGSISKTLNFTSGTGDGAIDREWSDTRTLTSGANDDLDLTALTQTIYGSTVTTTLAKVRAIVIVNLSTTSGEKLNIDSSVTNGHNGITGGASGKIQIPADSPLVLCNKKDGWTVDGTHKVLRITNAGSASADYKIVVLGTSV